MFDHVLTVYKLAGVNKVSEKIQQLIIPAITAIIGNNQNANIDEAAQKKITNQLWTRAKVKIGTAVNIKNIAKTFIRLVVDETFLPKLDLRIDQINFMNGIVNLKTGKYRKRNATDYVSKYLSYDYSKTIDQQVYGHVKQMVTNICNDDPQVYEMMLSFFGYCLTGETKTQYFNYIVGYSAQNGKSTILETMFQTAFDIYTYKMDNSVFAENYTMRHKQYINLRHPIRLAYVAELDDNKLDVGQLKDFTENKLNVPKMYDNAEVLKTQCKLVIVANHHPKCGKIDDGLKRRGLFVELKNKFIPQQQYDELEDKKGNYVINRNIRDLMNTDEYKLAFFQLLLPHAIEYWKTNDVKHAHIFHKGWKAMVDTADKFQNFIDSMCEITKDDTDRIHKNEFLSAFRTFAEQPNNSWNTLLNDVHRCKLEYKPQLRKPGYNEKGVLVCIKFKNLEQDDGIDKETNIKPFSKVKQKDVIEYAFHQKTEKVETKKVETKPKDNKKKSNKTVDDLNNGVVDINVQNMGGEIKETSKKKLEAIDYQRITDQINAKPKEIVKKTKIIDASKVLAVAKEININDDIDDIPIETKPKDIGKKEKTQTPEKPKDIKKVNTFDESEDGDEILTDVFNNL